MIIDDLKTENRGGRNRISARVKWEDCNRPDYELYFEVDAEHSDGFFCNPHAFLTGCIIPAFHFGEGRLLIDEEVCPELVEGIASALRIFRYWYYTPEKKIIDIEAKRMATSVVPPSQRHAGFFFSGGIDSFATICANRINFPISHPRSIKDGFIVFGLEQDDPELFKHVLTALGKFSEKDAFNIIPVYTNVYLNFRDEDETNAFRLWRYEFGSAALASVSHAFSRRVSTVSIASSSHLYEMEPWGSHPLVDHLFSSSDMRIIHDGLTLTRLDKIKLVAGWDLALKNLRVCNDYKQYRSGRLNCGKCEKCIRTMLGLLAIGKLNQTDAFPQKDVQPELVLKKEKKLKTMTILKPMYEEIIPGLKEQNRQDLVAAVEKIIDTSKTSIWKNKLVQIYKKHFIY